MGALAGEWVFCRSPTLRKTSDWCRRHRMYAKKVRYGDSALAGKRSSVGPLSLASHWHLQVHPSGYVPGIWIVERGARGNSFEKGGELPLRKLRLQYTLCSVCPKCGRHGKKMLVALSQRLLRRPLTCCGISRRVVLYPLICGMAPTDVRCYES